MRSSLAVAFGLVLALVVPRAAWAQANLLVDGNFSQSAYSTSYQLPNGCWGPTVAANTCSGIGNAWPISGPTNTQLQLSGTVPMGQYGYSGLAGWATAAGPSGYPAGASADASNPLFALYKSVAAATSASPVNEYNDTQQYFKAQGALSNSTIPGGGGILYIDADPVYRGVLYQTLTGLTPGFYYKVTFDWAAGELVNRTGATTENLSVSFGQYAFGSANFGSQTYFTTPTASLAAQGVSNWYQQGFTFIASSSTQVLSFLAYGTPAGDPPSVLLTDVSVQVPEPDSMALVGGAICGMVLLRRKRRSSLL